MKKLSRHLAHLCENYIPDAFVFCLLLTFVVFCFAFISTEHSALALVGFWVKDFWSLNSFAMQMVLILLLGHMLAHTPLINSLLNKLSTIPKNKTQALILLSVISTVSCWINWGFGLIVAGVLAVKMAQTLKKVPFGLFVATAYSGFLVWHGGMSGSIPLKIAAQDDVLQRVYPGMSIALEKTVFSSWNLFLVGILILVMPLITWMMIPEESSSVDVEIKEAQVRYSPIKSMRDFLEQKNYLTWIISLFFIGTFIHWITRGESLDLNKVNFIFLFLCIFLYQTPARFLSALDEAIAPTSGIIVQFPLYAGLMGIMQYSGLADQMAEFFVSISSRATLPIMTFLSAGFLNTFIPSGGGQWVVQGPIMMKAAKELGADPAKIAMCLAWGDGWTNLIQPFWTLPLLGLSGLKLKDIMSYCLVYLFFSGIIISLVLFL
jgi:short-chain fatty acids transporter